MSDIVIKAENLGKEYTIGHQAQNGRYVALRDVMVHNAKLLWSKTKDLVKGNPIILGDSTEEVWALKELNFEIKRGDRVGIIGRNGAGKSTLLKILSRITEPTTGRVTIKGRVASLLEVGTGFHPELTGRENIYLNGTILGMTRVEIKQKYDEIVAFAEIEKYLDTPVKRYSSGMYVRLAFAVAAHLEPEIMIVDEVLAVGDTQFQKKCLGKMEDVSTKEGKTVLFVSHNMTAIRNLCTKGLMLDRGFIMAHGEIKSVIHKYIDEGIEITGRKIWGDEECPGNDKLRLKSVAVFEERDPAFGIKDNKLVFELKLFSTALLKDVDIGLNAYNSDGIEVLHTASCAQIKERILNKGTIIIRYILTPNMLKTGIYALSVGANVPNQHLFFYLKDVITFQVSQQYIETSVYPEDTWSGILAPQVGKWEFINCK